MMRVATQEPLPQSPQAKPDAVCQRGIPHWGRFSTLCTALLLGACTLLPAPPTQQTYTLPTFTAAPRAAVPTRWSLRVHTPMSIALLDAPHIIVQQPNASLASYRGIRWADRAPVLLRDRLVQYFGDSGLFTTVVSDRTTTLPTDVALSITLRSFQLIHTPERATVTISVETQLMQTRGPRVLHHQTFTHGRVVDKPADPDAVIAAFGHATDDLAQALTVWIASAAPKDAL